MAKLFGIAGRQRLVPTGNVGPSGVFAFLEGRCLFTVSRPYIDTCTSDFVAQAPPRQVVVLNCPGCMVKLLLTNEMPSTVLVK